MSYLKINNQDFSHLVNSLKIGYETLVFDSGRNANGDMVIEGGRTRKIKVYVGLRHTTNTEMKEFLLAIENFEVSVTFLDPETNTLKTINTYTGTPEPEYYTISNKTIYKPMSLNFIEL